MKGGCQAFFFLSFFYSELGGPDFSWKEATRIIFFPSFLSKREEFRLLNFFPSSSKMYA